MKRIAAFDLDNTLIAGDSDKEWIDFLIHNRILDATGRARNEQFYRDYQQGGLDIRQWLSFSLGALASQPVPALKKLRSVFFEEIGCKLLLPAVNSLLDWHRNCGHKLLLITSTNRFVAEPFAKKLGIDSLLATEPEIAGDRFTGNYLGVPCFREQKLSHLNNWLQRFGWDMTDSYGYSDSNNDLPLLEAVSIPVAVDPDPVLSDIARQRGWRQLSLRQGTEAVTLCPKAKLQKID